MAFGRYDAICEKRPIGLVYQFISGGAGIIFHQERLVRFVAFGNHSVQKIPICRIIPRYRFLATAAAMLSAPSTPSSSSDSREVVCAFCTFIFWKQRRLLQLHLRIILLIVVSSLCYLGGYYLDLLLACYACRWNSYTAVIRDIIKEISITMALLAVTGGNFHGATLLMLGAIVLSGMRFTWTTNPLGRFASRWCLFRYIHIFGSRFYLEDYP